MMVIEVERRQEDGIIDTKKQNEQGLGGKPQPASQCFDKRTCPRLAKYDNHCQGLNRAFTMRRKDWRGD